MKNILFLICLSYASFAQNRQKGSYTVYLNNPAGSIKAEVGYEDKKTEPKESISYYWYTSNKIMETKGGFDGRLLDGPYTAFYLSDNLKEKGVFENGVKDEEWKSWYENGRIKEVTHWKSGMKHGIHKKYDPRGTLLSEATYKNGLMNGYEIVYSGDSISSKKKYSNGIEVLPKIKKATNNEFKANKESGRMKKWVKKKKEIKRETGKGNKKIENETQKEPKKGNEKKLKKSKKGKPNEVKPDPDKSKDQPLTQKLRNMFKKKEKTTNNELAKAKK